MDSLLIAARAVHYAATISVAGVFAFQCFVAVPQSSSRLRSRLARVAWTSLVLALFSGGAWLLSVSANMSGQPIAGVLTQGIVAIVLNQTRFGQVCIVRSVFAVILAGLLLMPRGWRGRLWRWSGLFLGAGLLVSLAWAGHGGATPGRAGDLHLAADMLHLLAAGAWVGALVPLALLLAEHRRMGDPSSVAVARRAVVRFSILAAISVAILLSAGLVNTWFLAGSVPALIGTEYGRLLLTKIAVFVTMVTFGAVNLLRMTPRLAPAPGERQPLIRAAVGHLRRNALVEFGLGLCVIGIVAMLGILPPGLHTEPGWPLPFRLEPAALSTPAAILLVLLVVLAAGFVVAAVAAAAARHYRAATTASGGLATCVALGVFVAWPAMEAAYPTSFHTPSEPYAAASVVHGARLYADNCALCHGADGKGNGPAAATLSVNPANLTEPHLFAHPEGDLYWWVSRGRANGVMPGFENVMSPADRWDVINFIRARAAGILSRGIGPKVSAAAAPAVPDFAFEIGNHQQTLLRVLQNGPALIALFNGPPPAARLAQLAAAQGSSAATGSRILAIDLNPRSGTSAEIAAFPPLVGVAPDVATALALFRTPDDGGETDLMLDRAANVRARWTAATAGGLPDRIALVADTASVARLPVVPENHAGHVH